MVKIPVRYLAQLQDVLKFATFIFGAIITLDFAVPLWNNVPLNTILNALMVSVGQLAAIALILISGWIIYLSSINSVIKPCVSEKDLALIPPERERGALFSVYSSISPCKRPMLNEAKPPYVEEERPIIKDVPTSVEMVINLDGFHETSGKPIVKDRGGGIYQMDPALWKHLSGSKGGFTIGKKYRALFNDDGIIVQFWIGND